MTRRILAGLAVAAALFTPGTAWADHGYGGDRYGYEDECRGGGCGNERDENYSQGGCKYICPQDSPITDSFNVCLPGATCYWDGRREGDREGQQPR